MSIKQVLVVDDEPDICELLGITLQRMGIEAVTTTRLSGALALLDQQSFDLCLTDMRMPDGDGLELVQHIQRHCPELPVAVITAHGSVDTAVRALQMGAFDFVTKPVNLPLLRRLVDNALRLERPSVQASIAQATAPDDGNSPLLGQSQAMRQLRATVAKLARSQAPVIVLGESGSGKELVAREIHRLGPRSDQPFVPVNCGAIPSELMESEFFGHQKGAFTGAIQNKAGLFREAHGGTLFLDEVAELPLALQVKLLRALQERAIKPVGANREEGVDVRVLSATHKDLGDEVDRGHFRQDLYYRLNVVELRVPPLRERPDDIPELTAHILRDIAGQWQLPGLALSPAALDRLRGHHFPGNVRELENILERAAVMVDGAVIDADLLVFPDRNRNSGSAPMPVHHGVCLDDHLAEQERRALEAALAQAAGNRTAAARALGLSFRQMRYRLKKLGID
ncbi:sigma-54-dependent transcriptional regulator [Thioalkalivibrio sp.]|uniref:sigma-54-dependent transcriptional regulator n=1 Tax=Thioalkalivibrio sp. TaxID=2093813 RepID=UPI003975C1EB